MVADVVNCVRIPSRCCLKNFQKVIWPMLEFYLMEFYGISIRFTSSPVGNGVCLMISFKRSFITPSSIVETFHLTRFPTTCKTWRRKSTYYVRQVLNWCVIGCVMVTEMWMVFVHTWETIKFRTVPSPVIFAFNAPISLTTNFSRVTVSKPGTIVSWTSHVIWDKLPAIVPFGPCFINVAWIS